MPRIPLLGGAYQSRAIISSSQRCINLYPEKNEDEQAPAPVTHFPTPGLLRKGTPPAEGVGRACFRASNGDLFVVVAGNVYFVDQFFRYTLLGAIPSLPTPVIMADNGKVVVLVDGTPTGYCINIEVPSAYALHAFGTIADLTFIGFAEFGVSHVAYTDTFFVFNSSGFNQWFISLSLVTWGNLRHLDVYFNNPYPPPDQWYAFDSLDYTSKIGSGDPVAGVACMHRNVWILGTLTGEAWYNSGSADFVFSALPGVYSERGCIAPYSIAVEDDSVYWLSRSRQGKCIVLRWDASFQIEEVSNPGIEAILGSFGMCDDAVGGTYQLFGHTYYVITFPTANRSFAVEAKSMQWHELAWTGPNGLERHRSNGWCHAYDMTLTIDRENGRLYQLNPHTFTDDGGPITRLRTIPHILNEGKRVRIDRVIADTQGGTLGGAVPGPYSRSIQDIIADLALPAPKLLLEAGSLASWPGSGQKWFDISGNGYDFFRGTDGTIGSADPVFNGVPGGISLSEFWRFGGSQYFTYDSPNEPWMNRLHKDGALWTALFWVYVPAGNINSVLFGNEFANANNVGVVLNYGSALNFGVANGSGSYAINIISSLDLVPNSWHLLGISVDEAAATGTWVIDGATETIANLIYTSPSAADASFITQIGACGDGGIALTDGYLMGWAAIWEGVALTPGQMTALYNAIAANNLLPSPRFSTPQIFLRVSYDRGGSFQDALPASLGNEGEYGELPWWPNLGIGRDIVFELSWSAPIDTALNGIFLEATPVGT